MVTNSATKQKKRSFTEVTMIVLKTPKAIKSSDHRKSALSHIWRRKQEGYLEGLKGKLRGYLQKISVDTEDEKELGIQLGW